MRARLAAAGYGACRVAADRMQVIIMGRLRRVSDLSGGGGAEGVINALDGAQKQYGDNYADTEDAELPKVHEGMIGDGSAESKNK